MAIRIPILTSFDPKGLKQANASFAKLQGSIGSLGKNFAVAGAAIGAIGVGLAKTVQTASSYAESVNAVNVAFGEAAQGIIDFGKTAATTLGVSQVDFNNAAVRFSAFAERIVGSGGDASKFIAEISTRASDFASVFNIEVSEALQVFQSGLAGEAEPLKRFGINLLDSEVKAYAAANGIGEVGKQLTETEKVQARYGLLMQATSKTSGDFANTSGGLANQLRILKAEVSNTEVEIGNQLLPVMAEILPIVRDLVRELGTQLVDAVKAVDWKTLATDVMNFTRFLVENATAIANVVVGIFALNTAYKLMAVASGIAQTAIALKTWYLAQLASGMTLATIATGAFSTALKLIPFVAIAAGLALVVTGITEADSAYRKTTPVVTSFGQSMLKSGDDAIWAANKYGVAADAINSVKNAAAGKPKAGRTSVLDDYAYGLKMSKPKKEKDPFADLYGKPPITTGAAKAGKAAGKAFADSASKTISKYQQQINDAIEKSLASVPLQDTWKESGNSIGNSIISGIQKSFTEIGKMGPRLVNEYGKQLKVIYDRTAKLQEAFIARTNFQVKLKQDIMGMFDFKTIKTGLTGIINQFKNQVEQTRKFRDNLAELQKLGLSGDLFRQIAEGQDFNTAAELVKGGAAAVNEVNSLFGSLSGFADEIATISGNSLYNLGVDAATGYVRTLEDGFADLQRLQKLESQKALIRSEIQAISTKLYSGVADPALRASLEARKAELIDRRNKLFGEGGAKTGGRFGRETRNLGIRTGLDQYFLGGGQMNSNIANQLAYLNLGSTAASVADREARALQRAQGRASAQGISVNVNGGISTSAQIGQAVIDAIRAYERASGQVYARA